MGHHDAHQPDYGTGEKKLSTYLIGVIACVILTVVAFWVVMANSLPKWEIFTIIYAAATIQFFVQVICFLRLNTETEQGKTNVMAFAFTGVVLATIIIGSLWIMWNTNFYMIH